MFLIPAVWMLTRIARARNGERMMSITADATFVVVLVFIACLLDLVMRRFVVRDEHDIYNRCASR